MGLEDVVRLVDRALQPGQFFVCNSLMLEWRTKQDMMLAWEIFRGRLLEPTMTRLRKTLTVWSVYAIEDGRPSDEPLLAVLLDPETRRLYVVRAIHCYAWEGYDAGGKVIESRETRKWLRELVGTITIDEFADLDSLEDELICGLFQAVVGTSRLPLTSVEAPLPAFSFGQLVYIYRPVCDKLPLRTADDLLTKGLSSQLAFREKVKLLETWLHTVALEGLPREVASFVACWLRIGYTERDIPELLQGVFQEISLSPHTDLVPKVLAFVRCLEKQGFLRSDETADFLTSLLRLTCRHLTAYDLVTFHHFGANYPDALLLDSVLKEVFAHVADHPELYFPANADEAEPERTRRLRRRGLRQGCLLRSRYEGHLVPDTPTSQGENARILPPTHPRVPVEQIVNPVRRGKKLFHRDPLTNYLHGPVRELLRQSVQDLRHPHELRELGMALFLDRPLGIFKSPIEPDSTPLFSYEAFSRTIAERRLALLSDKLSWIDETMRQTLLSALESLEVIGIPLASRPRSDRPVPVSLDDARKVADDFVFLRTTRRSLEQFFEQYDFTELRRCYRLEFLERPRGILVIRHEHGLAIYDSKSQLRVVLEILGGAGYRSRAGVEVPAEGLRVTRLWETGENEAELVERDSNGMLIGNHGSHG
jgi:hypothetical protein